LNHQNNRQGCNNSCSSCPYGRTPWGTREARNCGNCGRRPWNERSACGCTQTRSNCPCDASTTWRNRASSCSCPQARSSCSCATPSPAASCSEAKRNGDCDEPCNHGAVDTGLLHGKSLAMVYSPYQSFDSLYDPRQGLCNGTIFGELNKPFHGDGRGC